MLHPELANLDIETLHGRLLAPYQSDDAYAASYYDDVARHLRARGQPGTDALLQLLPSTDEVRAASILKALSSPPAESSAIPVLRSYLGDERPRVLLEVIDGLWYLGDRDSHDRIVVLQNHASPYVRGAVLRYLSRLFLGEARSCLRAALRDPHFVVRESAIDEIDELDVIDMLDDIRPFLNDPHPDVRQAARTAIANFEWAHPDIGH